MTQLLERAYAEVEQLTEPDQDAIAALILEELEDDRRWQQSFAQSPQALARLAEEALAEHRAGLTQPLDPERL
jgi:hypothetical protein